MGLPEEKCYTAREFFAMFPEESVSERYELLDGEIVAMAPPSIQHQRISRGLMREIDAFIRSRKGKCEVLEAAGVQLDENVVVIPDIFIACNPENFDEQKYNGAPDWVIEILSTNRYTDLTIKHRLYQDAGVREYWIVDPKNRKTLVYFFEKSDLPNIYTFETPIPVEIYQRELSLTIAELL